jgi:hypothetical protein
VPAYTLPEGRPTTVRWTDLTAEQQCVLLNAVERTYLFDVLNECARGQDWPDRLPQVPRLAQILEDLIDRGYVLLTKDSDEDGQPPIGIPADQVHAVLADPANWWSPDVVRPFALAPTDDGLAVYTSTPGTPPDTSQQ